MPVEAWDLEAQMNDAKCDPAGRLLTGAMTHTDRRSALYRVDPDLSVTEVFAGIGISNGLGWSPLRTRCTTSTLRPVVSMSATTGAPPEP